MKYPQLVSTRAVNAISDWLVSRLEQLGVEAPQIYTRLLLSLLQSSVQINDPIEFSNLETFFANRKGGNRRYLPCDTDTLKKLNAVQCLRDIVSTEQEIATIENLVDELCEKLKDIEKQTAEIEDEHKLLLATLTVPTIEHVTSHHSQQQQQQQHHYYAHNNHIHLNKQHHSKEDYELELDIETDPKKRYFRAFPALSKEMEDSFGVWRRNAKSLTWPVERSNLSLSSSSSSSTISNSFSSTAAIGKTSEGGEQQKQIGGGSSANLSKNNSDGNIVVVAEATEAEVKRKFKRRRNQALSKGKTLPTTRKNSTGNTVAVAPRQHRNSSPAYWDTDFEGCWEMGRDLIKEFRLKQNRQNRNRSTSEGEAYTMMSVGGAITAAVENEIELEGQHTKNPDNTVLSQMPLDNAARMAEQTITKTRLTSSSPVLQTGVDISFCCEDDDDDHGVDEVDGDETLASVSELTIDIPLNEAPNHRHEKLLGGIYEQIDEEDLQRMEQFKAKFNSNVEALWHDAEPQKRTEPTVDVLELTASSSLQTSVPNAIQFKDELKNFWNSYPNHNLDFKTINDPTQQSGGADSGNISLSGSGATLNVDNANNTSDYYSMPSDLNKLHSTPGRRRFEEMPIGVFLQPNSIWSDNSETSAADTDESFYYKVWNAGNGLQQFNMDVETKSREEKKITSSSGDGKSISKPADGGGAVFNLPMYNVTSKWSEGINAGPHSQQQLLRQKSGNHHMANVDCTDSTSGTSTSCTHSSSAASFNWHTPFVGGQNLQPDLQSWSASNPMSLTEMYGNIGGAVGGLVGGVTATVHVVDTAAAGFGSNVTLPNHCSNSSGFVEYARIKIVQQESDVDGGGGGGGGGGPQRRMHMQTQPAKDRYPEGENLLTSEYTHFHPIKSFSDGHSFNISGALDIIDYDRSMSGYLYLDDEKYLEYTRNDSFMAEDEVNAQSAGVSATPLYASSNCEAAQARHGGDKKQKSEFIIRFRLRNCDIGCQTDDNEFGMLLAANRRLQFETTQHSLCVLFAEGTPPLTATELACSNAIEALNKAVAVAAKAAAMGGGTHWQPQPSTINSYRRTSMWPQEDDVGCDEVDFRSGALEIRQPHWSTIGSRQCQHYSNAYDNNNSNNCCNNNVSARRAQHAASSHSLWGMCAACNNSSGSSESSELKSVPANRLLRDELQIEADEIMSDLKHMQDLYIGRAKRGRIEVEEEVAETSSDSDADAWDADDEDNIANERKDETVNADTTEVYQKLREAVLHIKGAEFENDLNSMQVDEDKEYGSQKEQPETQAVLQKVNRLLANLLGPENAKKVTGNEVTDFDENIEANKAEQQHYNGSLWVGSQDDADIWQATDDNNSANSNTLLKPMELLRHFNNEQHAVALQAEDDKFLSELSWEHDNLAEIWRQKTPPSTNYSKNTWCYELDKAHDENNETEAKVDNEGTAEVMVSGDDATNTNATLPNANENEQSQSKTPAPDDKRMHQQLFNVNASTTSATGVQKVKLGNRKRRHSASQNLFLQTTATAKTTIATINSNNNNNNLNVADLNLNLKQQQQLIISTPFDTTNFNNNNNNNDDDEPLKMQKYINASRIAHALLAQKSNSSSLGGDAVVATTLPANYAAEAVLALGSGVGGVGIGAEPQTIITCKYWTTLQPMPPTNAAAVGRVLGGETTTLIADEPATTFSCLIDKNASILRHVTMLSRPLTR